MHWHLAFEDVALSGVCAHHLLDVILSGACARHLLCVIDEF